MGNSRQNGFLRALFILVCFLGVAYLVGFMLVGVLGVFPPGLSQGARGFGYDFRCYYDTAKLIVAGKDMYAEGVTLLPLIASLLIPFSYLPFNQAFLLMTVVNISLFGLSLVFIVKILNHYGIRLSSLEKGALVLGVFLFFPVTQSFVAGQTNLFVLCGVVLFYYLFICKRRPVYAALSLSVASLVKFFPALLVFWAILEGRWRFLSAYITTIIGLGLLSFGLFGLNAHLAFLSRISLYQSYCITQSDNASLAALIFRVGGFFNASQSVPGPLFYSWLALVMLLLIAALGWLWRVNRKQARFSVNKQVLVFSLFALFGLTITAYSPIATFGVIIVLPLVLYLFVLEPSHFEKILLLLSITLIVAQPEIYYLAALVNDSVGSIIASLGGAANASLLLLVAIIYRLTRERDFITTCGIYSEGQR